MNDIESKDNFLSSMNDEVWLQKYYQKICTNKLNGYCLVSFKIKRFRVYNRLFGYSEGDQLISRVYQQIQTFVEDDEAVAHIYAGKFMLIMKFPKDYDELYQRIIAFNNHFNDMPDPFDIGRIYMGIGIYRITDFNVDYQLAQYCADICRAESKEALFRNSHFEIYGEMYEDKNLNNFKLEHEFKNALENGHICFYLQPKVNLKTGEINSAEALARWIDPDRGMIPLAEFFPILEENGLIEDLDLYIFEKVCKQISYFINTYNKKIKISVNLSNCLFNYRYFLDLYKKIHKKYPCPKDCIEIELLESIVLNQVNLVTNTVNQIHEYGFSCSLDDFGSGYSSFSVLTSAKIDTLKIDRSLFNQDMEIEKNVIVKNIIATAKELNMKVVAEGVENREYVKFLQELECDEIQGFIFYKPMPVEEFEERFIKRNEKAVL